jgi:hypothetical protein
MMNHLSVLPAYLIHDILNIIVQVPIMARRAVSETDNVGPIPTPEALLILGIMVLS